MVKYESEAPTSKTLKSALVGEYFTELSREDTHPDVEELMAYSSGALDADASEVIAEHLTACGSCHRIVLDVDSFLLLEPEEDSTVSPRTVRAWQNLQPRLPRNSLWRSLAVAASILVVFGLLSITVHQQRASGRLREKIATLEIPQADAPIIDLFPAGSVRGTSPQEPESLPSGSGFVTLLLNPSSSAEYHSFVVDLVAPDGEIRWSSPLKITDYGNFSLAVPGSWLGSAYLEIRLYGLDSKGTRHRLETFPLPRGPSS